MRSRGYGICLYVGEVHACTIAQVHACTITLVHACTLVTVHVILELQSWWNMRSRGYGICLYVGEVHACTISQVHACTITLVHACTLVTVHVILVLQSWWAILVGNHVIYLFLLLQAMLYSRNSTLGSSCCMVCRTITVGISRICKHRTTTYINNSCPVAVLSVRLLQA